MTGLQHRALAPHIGADDVDSMTLFFIAALCYPLLLHYLIVSAAVLFKGLHDSFFA